MIARLLIVLGALLAGTIAASAQDNYLIQPGDTLAIEILEDSTLNRQALVLPDGRISFPMAGSVNVGGRTTSDIERALSSRIASNFAVKPTVFVSVAGLAAPNTTVPTGDLIDVYLLGEVNSPGVLTITSGTTILQALAQSGGFTKFAATKRVQLRRKDAAGHQRLYKINYRDIARGAQITSDPTLLPGDVILVPERRLFE